MSKEKTQMLRISRLQMPRLFYPRQTVNMEVVKRYARYLQAGAEFPPILVGVLHNHQIIVDGWHRTNAYITLGEKYIRGTLKEYSSEKELFADAVRLNQGHGYSLNKQDRQRCVRRLKMMKFEPEEIMRLTSMPIAEVTRSWEKAKKADILSVSGPAGKRIDIPVRPNPTDEIRMRVIEALMLADNDETYEVVVVQEQKGKTISIPIASTTDAIRESVNEALTEARGNGLYELEMVLERALKLLNGTSNRPQVALSVASQKSATEIDPRLWEGPCMACGLPKQQCRCK